MKLKYIDYHNYRSIKDLKLKIDSNLIVLVGKNESGKSNILKGISLLRTDNTFNDEDIREPLPEEKEIEDSYIRFVFTLESLEREEIYQIAKELIHDFNPDQPYIKFKDIELTLSQFCQTKHSGLYRTNLINKYNNGSYWSIDEKKFSTSTIKYYKYVSKGQNPIKGDFEFYPHSEIIEKHLDKFEVVDVSVLNDLVGKTIVKFVNNSIPKVIKWEYDSNKLLPSSVNIQSFKNNPNSVEPLRNIFKIGGVNNIAKAIEDTENSTKNKLPNLLQRISTRATAHFKKRWKNYTDITISLEQNGENINCNIVESNKYSFNQRSDGFKRFISFLLDFSALSRNGELEDVILIIDEPDLGLHPSAIRDLRDELISLSEANLIIVSTHSIFMINTENLNHHLIVKKENEITSTEEPNSHNLGDEEVLYRALGHSIYDSLKMKNIIFEGWRDKRLFKIATSKDKTGYINLFRKFNSIGICHSNGVKQIKNITPIFELSNRDCIIVSDNDQMAKQYKREHGIANGFGKWYTYEDVTQNCSQISGEDFLKKTYIKSKLASLIRNESRLVNEPNFTDRRGIIKSIEEWIKKCGISDKNTSRRILETFKSELFKDLKQADIKPDYFKFLKDLYEKASK